MISISKTSTSDDKMPPGLCTSPASPSARWRHRGHPATTLVQQHVGTQPEAPAAAPSPSLALNHTVNTYIFTTENKSAHKPQAVVSAPKASRLPSILLLFPLRFSFRGLPLHRFCRQRAVASSNQNAFKSHTAELCPGREGGRPISRAKDALGDNDASDPAIDVCGSAPGRTLVAPFPPWFPLPSPLLWWWWPPSQAG